MYVITFANPKGGSGKTTAALLLAEQIARSSDKVAIIDCDPNQNVFTWKQDRDQRQANTPFSVYGRPNEDLLDAIEELGRRYDYLIIDLEGTADQLVSEALSRTDFCVIPFEPTPMETRQAARAVKLVLKTSKMVRRKIPYSLLFTRTNAAFQTSDERDVRTETNSIPALPVSLVRRAAFTRIFRDSSLLAELKGSKVSNLSAAIENAHAFAEALIKRLASEQEVINE